MVHCTLTAQPHLQAPEHAWDAFDPSLLWVLWESLHITMAFIEPVSSGRASQVCTKILAGLGPFWKF